MKYRLILIVLSSFNVALAQSGQNLETGSPTEITSLTAHFLKTQTSLGIVGLAPQTQCPPDRVPLNDAIIVNKILPFERVKARVPMGCSSVHTNNDGFSESEAANCTTNEKFPEGITFSDNPGHPYLGNVKSLYPDGSKPVRNIEFVSRDHASNETYLYLEDLAGGPDSHDVKSVLLLLPRRGVPTTKVVGEDVIVTMTTGETVVFDKNTHAIKSGALKEGPIDLTMDRLKRQPPNIQYTGEGISIRVNHRCEYPTMGADTAEIRQGNRVCKVARAQIWNADGDLITKNDTDLLNVINQKCPAKGLAPFHI